MKLDILLPHRSKVKTIDVIRMYVQIAQEGDLKSILVASFVAISEKSMQANLEVCLHLNCACGVRNSVPLIGRFPVLREQ